MFRHIWMLRRNTSKLLFLACALLILMPPALAYASTQLNYASGMNGVHGRYSTPGFSSRDYNRVWHQPGYGWIVWYQEPNGTIDGYVTNTSNPTSWPHPIGYAKAFCFNDTDDSGVTWTCQTTTGP